MADDHQIIRLPELCEHLGMTRQGVRLRIKRGKIPAPSRNPSNGWPYWHRAEIAHVLEKRVTS